MPEGRDRCPIEGLRYRGEGCVDYKLQLLMKSVSECFIRTLLYIPHQSAGLGLPPQHSTPTHLQKERRHPQPTSICFTYVTLLYPALYSNTLGKEPMQPFTVYCTQNRALRR